MKNLGNLGQREERGYLENLFQGFTFIEVMVTLTILCFILLMILGVIRLALSSWNKGEEVQSAGQRIRIGEQLLLRQIKSAAAHKIKSNKAEGDYLVFEGTGHTLKFISAYSLKSRKAEGLVLVTYDFQKKENGEGTLFLTEERVLNKDLLEEPSASERAIPFLGSLQEVRWAYFQEENSTLGRPGEWVEEWSAKEKKELPAALRLTLNFSQKEDKINEVTLLISLPAYRWEEIRAVPGRRILTQRPAR